MGGRLLYTFQWLFSVFSPFWWFFSPYSAQFLKQYNCLKNQNKNTTNGNVFWWSHREHMVDPSIHEELNKKNSKLLIKRMNNNQKKPSYSFLANQDILHLRINYGIKTSNPCLRLISSSLLSSEAPLILRLLLVLTIWGIWLRKTSRKCLDWIGNKPC
jgi:hypothetical protein